jgi:glycosyltransferase involved in cell wall biosynthesis
VPVLNEEASLGELHARLRRVLAEGDEIVIVDDGSTDRTRDVAQRLAAADPDTRLVGFRRNYGKTQALAAGFRRARGESLAMIDGDLQDEPAEIPRLLARLSEGYDLVSGWRRRRSDGAGKRFASWLFNLLVSVFGGVRFRDLNCGLKVFRREVLEDLVFAGGFHRFLPLLAHWQGFRVNELEVQHHPRRHGTSRFGGERVFRAVFDLFVILFLIRYEGRPGRWSAALGALLGLAGAVISLYILYLRLVYGSIQARFPLMALGLVLVILGMQLFSLGLIGELLAYQFRSRRHDEPVVWEGGREDEGRAADEGERWAQRRPVEEPSRGGSRAS